jgi:4-methyl-5(b-hydroxyethyl)-thiazole monophosphate biosynthesis
VVPDISIDKINAGDFDAIVLPGGYPGFVNLGQDERVLNLVREMLTDAQYVNGRVIVDGKLITSQGPGTAMEFSIKLVEVLVGKDKMEEVNGEVLAKLD